jgi:hypothetical protein
MGGDKNFVLFTNANAWGFNFHFFGVLFVDVLRFEIYISEIPWYFEWFC